MSRSGIFSLYALCIIFGSASLASSSPLSPYFYDKVCPQALSAIERVIRVAIQNDRRMGASLLRLHFHDCFVNGCDGSVLLDPSPTIDSEKNSLSNKNSARGFDVIDQAKEAVDKACGKSVVSCADILAVAARDSVIALGGPTWEVQLGRRDSTTASRTQADQNIPGPQLDLSGLIANFKRHGLNERDLVALSGAHTIGFAQCIGFRGRIYNESNIDPKFAKERRRTCPRIGGDSNLAPLDISSPLRFDTAYFTDLIKKRGLLHSDQQIFNGGSTDGLVEIYESNFKLFFSDFAKSMIKLGNIKPLVGYQGQIRNKCNKVN